MRRTEIGLHVRIRKVRLESIIKETKNSETGKSFSICLANLLGSTELSQKACSRLRDLQLPTPSRGH